MMESLTACTTFGSRQGAIGAMIAPAIDEDGRIRLPGFLSGLTVESYLPLVHLYANVVEASRILDRYRSQLRRLDTSVESVSIESATGLSMDGTTESLIALALDRLPASQTPLTALTPSRVRPHLFYKREDQTVTRAYKVRGAVVGMARQMESRGVKRFLAVSTGNHAMGVLKAAELLMPESVRVAVPLNTSLGKLSKLNAVLEMLRTRKNIKADLIQVGQTFDEAREWAMSQENEDEAYLDPYGDPWVVAGQGTLGLELAQQLRTILQQPHQYREIVVISPIGGGGLLTGTATALKLATAWEPAFRNIDVRFVGMRLADPDAVLGDAIRVKTLADFNHRALQALRVPILTMTDAEMSLGQLFVQDDIGRLVEGASGGAVFPALSRPDCMPNEHRLVVSLLSGANNPAKLS